MTPPTAMGVYTAEGFGNGRRKSSVQLEDMAAFRRKSSCVKVENLPDVKVEKPTATGGLGALTTGFLSGTTAHGLPKLITESSWIRKFAWLVIFVVFTSCFCLLMYHAVLTYRNCPVEINIKYKVRTAAEFPAVTVCNLNPVRKSTLMGTPYQSLKDIDEKYRGALRKISKDRRGYIDQTNSTHRDLDLQAELSAQGVSEDFKLQNSDFMLNAANDYDFDSFMKYSKTDDYSDLSDLFIPTKECFDNFGHQAQDFILQCSFDKANCSHLNFTRVYNRQYGNCFVFNLNATTTTLYGSKYGLRLTLNIEPEEYVGLLSHEVGARIAVHAANVTAFPEDKGINVPTMSATSIGVTTSTFTRLPAPYASMCADGTNHTLLDEGEYTVGACNLACIQDNMRRECGCSDLAGLPLSDHRCSLTNSTQEVCRQKTYAIYKDGQLGCYCPQPCNQVQYDSKVSLSTWPSASYLPILADKLSDDLEALGYPSLEDAMVSLARVHVYMEDLTIRSTEEFPAYTLEDLFANLGGFLGLFIGISACTMMEFFEFLMDAMGYAAVTLCWGSFVGCVQRDKKKTSLHVSRTPIEMVKLPPPQPGLHSKTDKKHRLIRVQPFTEAGEIGLGFNSQETMRW